MVTSTAPGEDGSIGPFKGQYGKPHVFARDVQSGVGNCVCGWDEQDPRHLFRPPPHGRIVRTYYRAMIPRDTEWTLWCESRDREEVVNSGRDRVDDTPIARCEGMRFEECQVIEVVSPWQGFTP